MSSQNVGSIHYDLELNKKPFDSQAGALTSQLSSLGDKFASFGKQVATAVGVTLAGGAVAAATAAFNQVKAVEDATFALRAYESDANKVNDVLNRLVKFARSDMGVLFNREDLFAGAQTLKLYGQATETLANKVELLARGVALGKTTFQELASIVGRAAAKGRLDAVDFDMLIERGIGLDKKFRGAAVSTEELFKALEKALPASLLEGRASTIEGRMVRLKSAFRDVGSSILGVDKNTSKFIEGGLGDRFMRSMESATGTLKQLSLFIGTYLPNALKTADEIFSKVGATLSKVFEFLKPSLDQLWASVQNDLLPALGRLWTQIQPLLPVIGQALVLALHVLINAITIASKNVSFFINQFVNFYDFFKPIFLATTKLVMDWIMFIPNFISQVLKNIVTIFNSVGKNGISGLFTGLISAWNSSADWLKNTGNRIANDIGNLSGVLWNAGKSVFTGLWNGMKDAWNGVSNWLGGIANKIKSLKGPIDKDRKLLVNEGGAIMQGLNQGLIAGFKHVKNTLGQATADIANPTGPVQMSKNYSNTFNAPIVIKDKADADYLLGQLMRDDQVIGNGLTPRRSIYGS